MDITETRQCNLYNLKTLSSYFECSNGVFLNFYEELLGDKKLLKGINNRIINAVENFGFFKGIFSKGCLDSVDWFAYQRILIYVLVRHLKPRHILETGVYYGGNTVFLLAAVHKNQIGTVHSIDLPDSKVRRLRKNNENNEHLARHALVGDSEFYDETLSPGFIVPEYLKSQWNFIEGNSHDIIPTLQDRFDFFLHDSDHSFDFLNHELFLASKKLTQRAVMVVDDLDWSNSFFKYCSELKLYPHLATDNGKDNLIVRTGIVRLDHPYNGHPDITGKGP